MRGSRRRDKRMRRSWRKGRGNSRRRMGRKNSSEICRRNSSMRNEEKDCTRLYNKVSTFFINI